MRALDNKVHTCCNLYIFVYSVNQTYTKQSNKRLLHFVGLINVEQHSKRKQAGETKQMNKVNVLIPVAVRSK